MGLPLIIYVSPNFAVKIHILIQKNNSVQGTGSCVQLIMISWCHEEVSDLSSAPQTTNLKLLKYFSYLLDQGFDPAGTTAGPELPCPGGGAGRAWLPCTGLQALQTARDGFLLRFFCKLHNSLNNHVITLFLIANSQLQNGKDLEMQ